MKFQQSMYSQGETCGLCGNFDGNQNNDQMSSNKLMSVSSVEFGNSWKVYIYLYEFFVRLN